MNAALPVLMADPVWQKFFRSDRPKVDPSGLSLVAERDGAKCRKSPGVIDNERGASGAHGGSSLAKIFRLISARGRAPGAWGILCMPVWCFAQSGQRVNIEFSTGLNEAQCSRLRLISAFWVRARARPSIGLAGSHQPSEGRA